ncbi:MAG: hypothetical protein MRY83_09670 [Flavobacteriales bacterium]|nr:hypothetical protein [Flavobacteriales bacterium]
MRFSIGLSTIFALILGLSLGCQNIQMLKRKHRKGITILNSYKPKSSENLASVSGKETDISLKQPQLVFETKSTSSLTPLLEPIAIESIKIKKPSFTLLTTNDDSLYVDSIARFDPLGKLAYGFGVSASVMGVVGLATSIFTQIGTLGVFIFILSFWPAVFAISFGIASIFRVQNMPQKYAQVYYHAFLGFMFGMLSLLFLLIGVVWIANNFNV